MDKEMKDFKKEMDIAFDNPDTPLWKLEKLNRGYLHRIKALKEIKKEEK